MIRSYCKKEDYFTVKKISERNYCIRFSAFEKRIDDVDMVYFTEMNINHVPTEEEIAALEAKDLSKRKDFKKQDVRSYAANALKFVSINDEDVWYDSEKRTSIVRSIEAERNLGQNTTMLEVNGHLYELTIDNALSLMDSIDKYSKDCYINTCRHENVIDTLEEIESVLEYDFSTGYPEKPKFNI